MLIRVILRAIPLFCVAIFTLAVYLADMPGQRGHDVAHLHSPHLAWPEGLVKCPDHPGNLLRSACGAGGISRITAPAH